MFFCDGGIFGSKRKQGRSGSRCALDTEGKNACLSWAEACRFAMELWVPSMPTEHCDKRYFRPGIRKAFTASSEVALQHQVLLTLWSRCDSSGAWLRCFPKCCWIHPCMGLADATLPALQDNGLWGYLSEKNLIEPVSLNAGEQRKDFCVQCCSARILDCDSSVRGDPRKIRSQRPQKIVLALWQPVRRPILLLGVPTAMKDIKIKNEVTQVSRDGFANFYSFLSHRVRVTEVEFDWTCEGHDLR